MTIAALVSDKLCFVNFLLTVNTFFECHEPVLEKMLAISVSYSSDASKGFLVVMMYLKALTHI
jgi:hypothetical protein